MDSQWYLFDDTDVSESKMEDDEELRSQCFGGENPTSSFDQPVMKRYFSKISEFNHNLLF